MPGPISESFQGPPDDAPYVPSWCYPNNEPKICQCGHHEGYHNDKGQCKNAQDCGCAGLIIEGPSIKDVVRLYYNNDALSNVTECTGVPEQDLVMWIDDKQELSTEYRKMLEDYVAKVSPSGQPRFNR